MCAGLRAIGRRGRAGLRSAAWRMASGASRRLRTLPNAAAVARLVWRRAWRTRRPGAHRPARAWLGWRSPFGLRPTTIPGSAATSSRLGRRWVEPGRMGGRTPTGRRRAARTRVAVDPADRARSGAGRPSWFSRRSASVSRTLAGPGRPAHGFRGRRRLWRDP